MQLNKRVEVFQIALEVMKALSQKTNQKINVVSQVYNQVVIVKVNVIRKIKLVLLISLRSLYHRREIKIVLPTLFYEGYYNQCTW